MKKRNFLLSIALFCLASCAKTGDDVLFNSSKYNSSNFFDNYYTEWNGIEDLDYDETKATHYGASAQFGADLVNPITQENLNPQGYKWNGIKEEQFGYNNKLSDVVPELKNGITSKLFDGRVFCEEYKTKARMQLYPDGFGMFFPKPLVNLEYVGFAVRGGTSFPEGEEFPQNDLKFNFNFSFYIHVDNSSTYKKVTYELENLGILCDSSGLTSLVSFFPSNPFLLENAIGISLTWSCSDEKLATRGLITEKGNNEKPHLALMLYEVFFGNSIWSSNF